MRDLWEKGERQYMEGIYTELKELGFKGENLQVLVRLIKSEVDLSKFYLFIMDNDGRYRTQLHLVHAFSQHMQELRFYQSSAEFTKDYITAGVEKRKVVLDKLFDGNLSAIQLVKVYEIIDAGVTLEELYDTVKHYRRKYNINEAMIFILNKYQKNIWRNCYAKTQLHTK